MRIKIKLAALMKERNMSEAQLAERAEVARNTVRSLMRDANTRVDFIVLERIAVALGVRPLELMEETDQPRGPVRLVALPV